MARLFSTRGLAGASGRHPWRTLGVWLLLLVLAGVLQAGMGTSFNGDSDFTNNPESKQASALIDAHSGEEPDTETVVVQSTRFTVDDPAFRQKVEGIVADLKALPSVVASVTGYLDLSGTDAEAASKLVSADRHTTLLAVTLAGDADDLDAQGAAYVKAAQGRADADFAAYSVGDLSGNEAYGKISDEDLGKAEKVGLPVALLVLVVVFGALVAPGLPLLLGLIAIFVAVGLTAIVSKVLVITDEVTVMISMIGLAVGIDYALFVIERYREERRLGVPKHQAIELAGATAGKAVFFSGGTVILALTGMFLLPITVFHSLAAGAILAVLVAMLATQTFIPAMLGLLGDWIDFPRQRRLRKPAAPRAATIGRGFWGRTTRLVMAKPVVSLLFAGGILVGLALPAVTMKTGVPGLDVLPPSDVKTGYLVLNKEFYAGLVAPVDIAIDGKPTDPWVRDGVAKLGDSLAGNDLYGPLTVSPSDDGAVTIVTLPLAADPESPRSYDAIGDLRAHTIPAAFGAHRGQVYVGGDSAENADFNAILKAFTPRVFLFVLGLSFLLLTLAFRSLVVPAKAIVMNLLSVGAAYGTLVLVFQHGIGADLLGVQRTPTITTWLPIFLFCVLFGLSMDYHVFLLSRIREHYDLTHRNEESVAVGLQATGKIITGAALIMVAVFGAFASGRLADIQQMGLGLAAAVFLDATLVRSILVPAAMKLLGDRNWYLPRWLGWLPDLRIEGAPDALALAHPTPAD